MYNFIVGLQFWFWIIFAMLRAVFILPNIYCEAMYTRDDLLHYREEVRAMFTHAYDSYLRYAYPLDELRPLTCDGVNTWGSYSLTLIDALDTLVVMGNYTEFALVVEVILETINFDSDINVSVFETNIRVVGGLISAHILSHKAGLDLEPNWPCEGPLLRLAEVVAKKLLPAFDTPTGMPYGTVNLKNGVPPDEVTITCVAGISTYLLEFGTLSRLTGNPVYENVALRALNVLFAYRSHLGLVGNHIDIVTGEWTAQDSGIGAGIDSYFEYLVKGALLFNKPQLMAMFSELLDSIDHYIKHENWYFWVSMRKGYITWPVFQSLEAFWPGVLSQIGNFRDGLKSIHRYHKIWKKFGFTPESVNIIRREVEYDREGYPLRPELAESIMYLYRATGNPYLLDIGVDILRSIQHSARTPCGYATIKNCTTHEQDNRMESFFLAETTKYLYLLFDTDNFAHNRGQHCSVRKMPSGKDCILDAGYVFNTEAHLIDTGIIHCCTPTTWSNSNNSLDIDRIKSSIYKSIERVGRLATKKKRVCEKTNNYENVMRSIYELKCYKVFEKDVGGVKDEGGGNDIILENIGMENESPENNDARELAKELKAFMEIVENDVDLNVANEPTPVFKKNKAIPKRCTIAHWMAKLFFFQCVPRSADIFSYSDFDNFDILRCKPQPFLHRLTISGQFFN